MQRKQCKKCGRWLPLTYFHADKHAKDGHRAICKDCRSTSKGDKWFRTVEHFLYCYEDEQKALREAEEDIICAQTTGMPVKIEHAGFISDKTGNAAIRLSKPDMENTRKWLKVTADLLQYYKTHNAEYYMYIQRRYKDGISPSVVCDELFISTTTGAEWRNAIVGKGKELAAAAGLIPYEDLIK